MSSVVNHQSLTDSSELGSGMLMKSDQNSPPSSLGPQDVKMVQLNTLQCTCTCITVQAIIMYVHVSYMHICKIL